MVKTRDKIWLIIVLIGIFWGIQTISYAGTQTLNSLEYQAQLNEDGSMDVVEKWDIYVKETNTLVRDFELDSSKYSEITNVKVKDATTGREFKNIYEEMYHVTLNCYYGLIVENNQFEIAWGVGLDNSSANKKYEISYTIKSAVTVYNDCSELYWQFIGKSNGIRAEHVTGTIKLPSAVNDGEHLRVWAHGPLNGEISKKSNDTIVFFVDDLSAKTMLETRVVVEEPMFEKSMRMVNQNKLEDILMEEGKWAREANLTRVRTRIIFLVFFVIYIGAIVFLTKKIVYYLKELKIAEKNKYQINIGKYFRDIPREKDATPAEAAFLYYFNLYGKEKYIISATLLQLCLKGYISFEKEGKKDIRIYFLKPSDEQLKPTESIVYRLLRWPSEASQKKNVTMKEIEKEIRVRYDEFDDLMKTLRDCTKEAHEKYENYRPEMDEKASNYNAKAALYLVLVVLLAGFLPVIFQLDWLLSLLFGLPIILGGITNAIILGKLAKAINILTEKGEIERQQWNGLKNYMEDFSLLKEKEIPDLVLWEKYLIYATVFGISDKVVKQLEMVYPQMQNLDNSTYTYMYLMSDKRFSDGFIGELNRSTNSAYTAYQSAYHAAHSSSSSASGSGGGFSSGGGGRRRRWPEWDGR